MNGCTIPYTPIAVDLWKVRQCQRVRLFFLSHVHLDQNCGLTSSWSMPIYCSPLSKKLLLQRFSLNPDVVHALELNVPHTIPLTNNEDVTMTVTLIDANHCPGSVMFFFEGYFGRILYTGDFRYAENMITTPPFCDIISKPIDALYMDNTYCSPKCVFPPRDAAQREILTIIEQHPKEKIVIGLRNLGKENLLIAIASHFGTVIKVSEERYKTLELLNAQEQFSMTDNSCRIEVVPMMQVTQQNMDAWISERPTIAILPTAIFTALGFLPFHGQRDTIVVPYSDHCSYAELHRFVAVVRPKSVIPIVRGGIRDPLTSSLLDRTSVECFLEYYDKTPMTNYHIPVAVLELMNQMPSRNGCGRRSGASQKAESRMKLQRPIARKRKSNENKPSFSGPLCNAALVPLEPKTNETKDANHSNSSATECQHLEKPKRDMFSNKKNTDKIDCLLPPMKSSSANAVPVTKSNGFGTKLSRCASSDCLLSPCFRPHVKLRSARVASPDLRMQLKRKASADLKRFYANTHSNLIRTRRVRLCSAHACRTLCHGSKNCHSGNASIISRTSKEMSRTVLEMNRGEETMYLFTDDLLRKLRSPKELQKDFEMVANFQDANSTSCHTNQSNEENQSNEMQQSLRSFTSSSDRSSPTSYVRHSPVVHEVSSVHLNSPDDVCATTMESTAIMDLRNKGLIRSDSPPPCLIMTPSTPQVARRSEYPQGENHGQVTKSNNFIFDPGEKNFHTVVEPSFPGMNLSMQVTPAGIPTFPIQVSCASIPLTMMDQYQYHNAITASMFQLHPSRNRMISDSHQPPSWNPLSSLVYSAKTSVISLTSEDQSPERLAKRPCIEPRTTAFYDHSLGNSSHNALHSHSPAGTCGQCSTRDRSPVGPTDELSQESNASLPSSDERSAALITSNLCNPASESGCDAAAGVVEQTDANKLMLETRNDEKQHCSTTGKMVLHAANPVLEDKLPPKKNWRHRFGMSQLHKSHQESKWLEPNSVAKLLVANGTMGNSRT